MRAIIRFFVLLSVLAITGNAQEIGSPAPDFSLTAVDGQKINLSDYKGKVVLLDFWASWCIPCRKEMPFLVKFYNHNKDKEFVILAVNIDDKAENMNKFLSQLDTKVPFPIIHDAKKEIPPKYDLQAMPTTAFIDKNGNIRYRHTGFKDSYKEDFSKELETLLSETVKSEEQ